MQVHTYAVVPVSVRAGLVEWVQETKPLAELLEESDKRVGAR